MKVIIQILICCTVFGQLYAQQKVSDKYLSKKENATWKFFEKSERVSVSKLAKNKALLKLGTKDELKPVSNKADKTGMRHYRYQQMHNGVPVEWAVYLMREKDARVTNANGSLIQGLNVPSTPSISEARALQTALQYTNAAWYAWEDDAHEHTLKQAKNNPNATFYPSGELVIIDPQLTQQAANCRLAYKFDIYAVQPLSRQVLYIDAHSAEVLKAIEKIYSCTDVPASGDTNYSGTVNFTVCYADSVYTLKNSIGGGMQVFDARGDISLSEIPCQDPDGHFDTDAAATEVHSATQKTYEYFDSVHYRNGIDGSDAPLLSWVHYGNQTNNAYWNGTWMLYGDGDGIKYSSLTSPDIVAHEIGHGLTDYISKLIYEGESGALNESFSDIFGEVIERHIRGSNDWIVGADFTLAPKNGLRNLAKPNDPTMTTRQPDTYLGDYYQRTGFADYGGVHTNSGIQNHWFYLLSEGGTGTNDNGHTYDIEGMGMEKAAAIAYNLTTYLTSNANFKDARLGAIQAAENLGYSADEVSQVDAAWCAVGVGPGCVRLDCSTRDSLALVAWYNSTNGANWDNTWELAQPMHSWDGVTTNEEGCVIDLDLHSNNLSGSIPLEIGNLNDLSYLDLSYNDLSGSIPPEIGNLNQLRELYLYSNQLTDTIPPQIGNLSQLEWLWLGSNNLSGSIPPEIENLNQLSSLYLSANQLSGTIPPELGNLNNLSGLNLYGNKLSGDIPSELGSLNQLKFLNLFSNELSGTIPSELGNLNLLEYLNLSDNQLSGDIPSELGNLNQLQKLYLYDNQLSGCFDISLLSLCLSLNEIDVEGNNFNSTWEGFCNTGTGICSIAPCFTPSDDSLALVALYNATNGNQWTKKWDLTKPMTTWHGIAFVGRCVIKLDLSSNNLSDSIPSELGNLSQLQRLDLDGNELSGDIPSEIGNLNLLTHLDLSINQLSGSIPSEIGNLNQLSELDLSSNNLSDSIPLEIENLNRLRYLYLDNNDLSGSIPPEIRNLNQLRKLDLSFNQLSGSIPPEIGNLNLLDYLNLYDNDLSASIPLELGNLNKLEYLYLSDNELSGNIPSAIGNLNQLQKLSLDSNQLSGSIPPEIGNLNQLSTLDLSSNDLNGSIPPELGNLNKLEYLFLQSNQLSASIPSEIGNLNQLQYLYLYDNQLSGNIPPEIGNLNQLVYLDLYYNQLSGSIPPTIGNLNQLQSLYLDSNQLSGSIPSEIGNLNQLEYLYLQSNQLSGCFDQNLSNLCNISSINIDKGNNFDPTWEVFCTDTIGICPPKPVLPGDFNNDGIADKTDLIYWGLAKGYTGHTRPDSTTEWIPQDSPEWDAFIGGINSKHQDADGNGIVDEADYAILEQNYGKSSGDLSYSYNPSPAIYTLRQVTVDAIGGQTTYELYLHANAPINTHGISVSVEFKNSPNIWNIEIDTTGSALQPTHYIQAYSSSGNDHTITFALTRTDKSNQPIDGPIAKLIIADKDIEVLDPTYAKTNRGKMMSATGVATSVGGSTLHGSLGGANPTLPVFLAVNPAYCRVGGTAEVIVSEGTPPYTYMWSTGATSSKINDLDIGTYNVTVNDATGLANMIDFEIEWAFTPVEVSADTGQICFDFEDAPLTEKVEVSLDNGLSYLSPITEDTCYSVSKGTYPVWIRLASDTCSTHLADLNVNCADADQDGICDADDVCPNFDDTLIGTPCDDSDACTTDDVYTSNCECIGAFVDTDGDGICDADDVCPEDASNTCDALPNYCESMGSNTNHEYIDRVTFADIDNTTGNNGGYGDFTNQVATVSLGDTVPLGLVPGFSDFAYNEDWRVWIDFNKDGNFNDSDEHVFSGNGASVLSSTVEIPTDAVLGLTGMRVSMRWNNFMDDPCDNFTYGEVEDYTVNISAEPQNYPQIDLRDEEYIVENPAMRIAPNPATEYINISFRNIREGSSVAIYNTIGQLVSTHKINNDHLYIPINELPVGMYILHLQIGDDTYTIERFVKL